MKKTINKFALTLIGILLFYSANGKPNTSSDAIYNYINKEYILGKDGSITYNYSSSIKLLTYRAFHNLYGESFIVYNPKGQSLEITKSQTTMRDGKLITTPKNGYNEVLPQFCTNSAAYNMLREMIVTHTGLETGAVIDFAYTLKSEPDFTEAINERILIAEKEPVKKYTITVKVPKGHFFVYEKTNNAQNPVKESNSGWDIYTWIFNDVMQIPKENNSTDYMNNYPSIAFSTSENNLMFLKQITLQPAFKAIAIETKLLNSVISTVSNEKDPIKKAIKTANYIVDYINTDNIPVQLQNKTLKSLNEVFYTNSGTALEKTLLLSAILKSMGINNSIVFAVPSNYINNKLFIPDDIRETYIALNTESKVPYLISAVNKNTNNFIITPDNYKYILLNPVAKKMQLLNYKTNQGSVEAKFIAHINPNLSFEGKADITMAGTMYPSIFNFEFISDIQKYIATSGKNFICRNFIKDKNKSDQDILVAKFDFTQNDSTSIINDGYKSITLPAISNGIQSKVPVIMNNERNIPLLIQAPISEKYDYIITVANEIKILNEAKKISIHEKFGSLFIEFKINKNTITIKRHIKISTNIIEPGQYDAFRKMINMWNNPNYKTIYFKYN